MIYKVIKFCAQRFPSSNGKFLLAALYGMLACFGGKGTFALINRMRKEFNVKAIAAKKAAKKSNRVTFQATPTTNTANTVPEITK